MVKEAIDVYIQGELWPKAKRCAAEMAPKWVYFFKCKSPSPVISSSVHLPSSQAAKDMTLSRSGEWIDGWGLFSRYEFFYSEFLHKVFISLSFGFVGRVTFWVVTEEFLSHVRFSPTFKTRMVHPQRNPNWAFVCFITCTLWRYWFLSLLGMNSTWKTHTLRSWNRKDKLNRSVRLTTHRHF